MQKLTPEQRDWLIEETIGHIDFHTISMVNAFHALLQFEEILNQCTEDEDNSGCEEQ